MAPLTFNKGQTVPKSEALIHAKSHARCSTLPCDSRDLHLPTPRGGANAEDSGDDDRESGAAPDADLSPPAAQLPERLSLATIGSELDYGTDALDDDDDDEEEEEEVDESSEGLSI